MQLAEAVAVVKVVLLAFLWGWGEATWFFIIPDVWLTFTVMWGRRVAVASIFAAVAGAMLGAVTLFCLPQNMQSLLYEWWTVCPGYRAGMFPWVQNALQNGPAGMLDGPWEGVPYRYYLWVASHGDISLATVLWWTPLARIPRMLIGPALAGMLYWLIKKQDGALDLRLPLRKIMSAALLVIWVFIYGDYWFAYLPRRFP